MDSVVEDSGENTSKTMYSVWLQVMMGERAVLQCLYDMEGEELYSVKWYKAGHEFFR